MTIEPPADTPRDIEAYIATFPPAQQAVLAETLRRMRAAAPGAVESIRYGMPALRLHTGHPVYFAGWKQHLSLHDIPSLPDDLEADVAPHRSGKDTLRFPYNRPVPFDVIERIVAHLSGPSH